MLLRCLLFFVLTTSISLSQISLTNQKWTSPYPSFIVLVHLWWVVLFAVYFFWHNCPLPFYPFVSKFFPDDEIFKFFCDIITPTKMRTLSGETPMYHVIYSSWPNICIRSLEVAKVSKPAPSDIGSLHGH